jgi:hypothetical protein
MKVMSVCMPEEQRNCFRRTNRRETLVTRVREEHIDVLIKSRDITWVGFCIECACLHNHACVLGRGNFRILVHEH